MCKKVIYYPEATVLKSYDTFVAVKRVAAEDMVTQQHYSKTTTRQINEFFGGSEVTKGAEKVSQELLDVMGKFIEAHQ